MASSLHAKKRQKVTHEDMQQLPAAIVKELRDKYIPSEVDNLVEHVMTRMTDERYVLHYEGLRGVDDEDDDCDVWIRYNSDGNRYHIYMLVMPKDYDADKRICLGIVEDVMGEVDITKSPAEIDQRKRTVLANMFQKLDTLTQCEVCLMPTFDGENGMCDRCQRTIQLKKCTICGRKTGHIKAPNTAHLGCEDNPSIFRDIDGYVDVY